MSYKPTVGDTIKVLSVVGKYSNAAQLKNAFLLEVTSATDSEKVAIEKADLTLTDSVLGEKAIALPANGAKRTDVTIAWEVTAGNDIASIADGKLNISNPTAETTVTVQATIRSGESVDSKVFTIVVSPLSGEVVSASETFAIAANAGTLVEKTITWNSDNFEFVGKQASSTTAIRTSDSDHYRIYQGSTFAINGKNGAMITKVVITVTESKYASILAGSLKTAGVTATYSGTTVTLTVDAGSVASIEFSATAQTRVKNFVIDYLK